MVACLRLRRFPMSPPPVWTCFFGSSSRSSGCSCGCRSSTCMFGWGQDFLAVGRFVSSYLSVYYILVRNFQLYCRFVRHYSVFARVSDMVCLGYLPGSVGVSGGSWLACESIRRTPGRVRCLFRLDTLLVFLTISSGSRAPVCWLSFVGSSVRPV